MGIDPPTTTHQVKLCVVVVQVSSKLSTDITATEHKQIIKDQIIIFWHTFFFTQNIFRPKSFFGPKLFFRPKSFFGPKSFSGLKYLLGPKYFFSVPNQIYFISHFCLFFNNFFFFSGDDSGWTITAKIVLIIFLVKLQFSTQLIPAVQANCLSLRLSPSSIPACFYLV